MLNFPRLSRLSIPKAKSRAQEEGKKAFDAGRFVAECFSSGIASASSFDIKPSIRCESPKCECSGEKEERNYLNTSDGMEMSEFMVFIEMKS